DGGPVGIGLESTVLDVSVQPPLVLRPGGLTREALEQVLGPVSVDPGLEQEAVVAPRSPGMKYRHYAPACPAVVVEGAPHRRRETLVRLVRSELARGRRVGVIATSEGAAVLRQDLPAGTLSLRVSGSLTEPERYASTL